MATVSSTHSEELITARHAFVAADERLARMVYTGYTDEEKSEAAERYVRTRRTHQEAIRLVEEEVDRADAEGEP